MDNVLNCGPGGWLAIAVSAVAFGVLILAGAALIKDVFFAGGARPAG